MHSEGPSTPAGNSSYIEQDCRGHPWLRADQAGIGQLAQVIVVGVAGDEQQKVDEPIDHLFAARNKSARTSPSRSPVRPPNTATRRAVNGSDAGPNSTRPANITSQHPGQPRKLSLPTRQPHTRHSPIIRRRG